MPVTITAVDTIQLSIPLDTWAPPPLFAGKPRTHVEAIYVRVTTSSGVVGWGESFGSSGPLVGAAFDRWIKRFAENELVLVVCLFAVGDDERAFVAFQKRMIVPDHILRDRFLSVKPRQ